MSEHRRLLQIEQKRPRELKAGKEQYWPYMEEWG